MGGGGRLCDLPPTSVASEFSHLDWSGKMIIDKGLGKDMLDKITTWERQERKREI
jgi:hypothetical protein